MVEVLAGAMASRVALAQLILAAVVVALERQAALVVPALS
jgi:hypothetical protein